MDLFGRSYRGIRIEFTMFHNQLKTLYSPFNYRRYCTYINTWPQRIFILLPALTHIYSFKNRLRCFLTLSLVIILSWWAGPLINLQWLLGDTCCTYKTLIISGGLQMIYWLFQGLLRIKGKIQDSFSHLLYLDLAFLRGIFWHFCWRLRVYCNVSWWK